MIDVYDGTGPINWQRVYATGVRRAYIKRSEANFYADARCKTNVEEARAVGITPGVYHFAGSSVRNVIYAPHREAAFFLDLADGLWVPGDLPPALDLEKTYGHDWAFLNDWKAQWFAVVDEVIGCRAVFYSYYYYWKQMRLYPDRPVWGAGYGSAFTPPASWAFHQYSATGRVDGIGGRVDLDRVLHPDAVPAIPAPAV